jgi:predicted transcriptional regulator
MAYYNTTRETGDQLKVSWKKTENQDDQIMEYFRVHGEATPSEVWVNLMKTNDTPITSVRRSITNLTSSNLLIKTDKKRDGIYGRPEYVWRKPSEKTQMSFLDV